MWKHNLTTIETHSKSEQKKNSTSPSASLGGAESKKNGNGPNPTASSSALRKLVEEGGEFAEKMKTCIIRAAVHASRSGQHGRSFKAPNGEVYPDISKAFAVHAGLKPCNRCKNNKQGVSFTSMSSDFNYFGLSHHLAGIPLSPAEETQGVGL